MLLRSCFTASMVTGRRVALFSAALSFLLFLSSCQDEEHRAPSDRSDCEDTTYQPYAPGSLQVHIDGLEVPQRCPEEGNLFGDRLLVAAGSHSETSWMSKHISIPFLVCLARDWQVYQYEDGAAHSFTNVGRESMAYLTFLSSYYDCLPKVVLFAHGHRQSSWHSTNALDYNVDRVRWEAVPGFAILRRRGLWYDTWMQDISKNLEGMEEPDKLPFAKCTDVLNGTSWVPWALINYWRADYMVKAWDTLFQPSGEFGGLPERVQGSITSEFFVTRDRIRGRSRKFYLQAMQWILSITRVEGGMNGYEAGVVFENLWHHIFGEPAFQDRQLTVPECTLYRCNATEARQAQE